MKIELTKKKKIIIFLIVCIIALKVITNFIFGPWIVYKENVAPEGQRLWNTMVSYTIKVTRFGRVFGNSSKKVLNSDELNQLKSLAQQLENNPNLTSVKDFDQVSNGLSINGKTYLINFNSEERQIYYEIGEMVK